MLNRIIKFSLDNRIAVIVMSIVLLIYGMIVLLRTKVDIFPDLNAPTVVVMTEAPGMAPEEIEKVITYPVETAVNGASGVRRVRSASAPGLSSVWVEFDWGTDVYLARQIVSEKLSEIESDLPPNVGKPTLGPQSSILGEILIIGLTADSLTTQEELRTIADRQIRPRLLSLSGVASVSVIGGDAREYQILLHPSAMRRFGVGLQEVRDAVGQMNANASGGVIYEHGNEYIIKGDISTGNVDDLSNSLVRTADGTTIRLSDIATIKVGAAEPRLGAASLNSQPAVLVTVTKQPAVGTINLTDEIESSLSQIRSTLPADVKVNTDIFRQSDFISTSIGNLQESLFIGAIFVIVVLFFFLMNLRTTVISLVALPLSIIVTVLVLHFLGLTINTMSLGGIAIAIGSLVDDAIVDVENVYKRLRERHRSGESVLTIVYDASKEVRLPIFNSSLIIMASFLPLFFLDGMEGKMLKPLGISFIVALVASTIVALTVTPVLCSFLLGSKKAMKALDREPKFARALRVAYEKALSWSLGHAKLIFISTAILFAISVGIFFTLGRSFLPSFNEGSLTINVSALPGISLEESDRLGREAEKIILAMPEIELTARKTGRAELDEHSLGVNVSEIEAPYTLDNGRSRNELLADLRHKLSHLPGVNIEIGQPISHRIDAMLSGTEAQIAIKLFGDDLAKLYNIGNRIKHLISDVPGVVDVNIEQQVERPQLDIRPKRDMLVYYGVTIGEFADFINVALAGEKVSQVYENGFPYDLTLRMAPDSRSSIDDISDLMIDTSKGKVPLSELAEIVSATGPNTINRENVSRRIVISANVSERDLRGTVDDIRKEIESDISLPEGYFITYGGQFENEAKASATLALVSLVALIVIFLLLYGQYHSVSQSLVILLNMPLAIIGGVILLRVTGGELNIPAIIGFISLLGITTRNGMLLMSRYDQLRAEGMVLRERVMLGSSDRLNPILMTALSSALALIPLAVNGDKPGNEIQSPLAIVILGGLLTSTVLNIFIVPLVYRYINRKENTNN
ncbi:MULTISPECIES: efflux RND transporter permease subunit [Duncaniella]|uniref:efflux RND transporter permease subunit n=3 Tax=Muribaculaceae TaxID=2005473 RepID=UPI000E9842F2|nr:MULTISPECIES: efflux RND transporter permease subunit [Duncaniella]MCX4284110.1 efflux RND transporter permease subunit [Duncaniella dubosii]HBN62684.1 CusA/CzcA family heavy metal efflux RND transporter [Porphyromonadaceae bacterium]